MLKPIDFLVGLKILTSKPDWTQMGIAGELCLSSSQVNSAIKQLLESNLFTLRQRKPFPIYAAMQEFILSGMPYCFPAKTGELTVGTPTAYAAEPLSLAITRGKDPIPVWPYAQGKCRGVAVEPLHKNVPKALSLFPDPHLHDILVLIDALRIGRAREKKMAEKLLTVKFDEVIKSHEKRGK